VNSKELNRIVADACQVFDCLRDFHEAKDLVQLDDSLKSSLGVAAWKDFDNETFKLPRPNQQIIGDWLDAVGGWVGATQRALAALMEASLEELLATEAHLLAVNLDGAHLPPNAPAHSKAPTAYTRLLSGKERQLQTKLNLWDSFQTASGFFPALMRFLISFTIIGIAIYMTLPEEWARIVTNTLGSFL